MPSTITHAFIGLDTIKKLNNKPKKIINDHINNYKIYCQNMDVLYFYHIFLLKSNKVEDIGHRFHHEHVFDVFNRLIMDNKDNKNYELFTFISGLITHYMGDTTIHPYVNHFANYTSEAKRFSDHFEVETYIDNYFVNERLSKKHKSYNNSKFIFNYTEEDIIKKELDKIFLEFFNFKRAGYYYYRSLKEMKFTYNFVRYDKHGFKKLGYKLIDLNPFNIPRVTYLSYHFDVNKNDYYLNLSHNKWTNPDTKEISNKSFFDLYNEVLDKSSNIINKLYDYIFEDKKVDLKDLIKDLDYGNGLPISPNK